MHCVKEGKSITASWASRCRASEAAKSTACGWMALLPGRPHTAAAYRTNDVITHVNGRPIYDADGLVLNVSSLPAAAPIRLTVLRHGQVRQFDLELAKGVGEKRIVTAPQPLWRGMRVDFSSAISGEFLQRLVNEQLLADGGVVVAEVTEDSPAGRAGIRPEMVITHVGNTRVQTPKEFEDAVAGKTGTVELREVRPPGLAVPRPSHFIDPE